jgi:hypothetical protein
MRDFYDDRLRQMETALSEKEAEREQLVQDLVKAKSSGRTTRSSQDLEARLKEKESHIATLRKKQQELQSLTAVSSRNLSEINRLQEEVSGMKRTKVDMQKLLHQERKNFANEKKQLQKDAIQKERELSKWKQMSNKREIEAQKAGQVAKARLQELGHLRSKYKDAETKVRVLSLKNGVMAKAGLDPVLVGRRGKRKDGPDVDADLLRDYFDQKVASIVRKEALVDKLAHEWEEHFELTQRMQEVAEGSDEAESLSIRLKFKEDRIRQFAQRIGRNQEVGGTSSSATSKPNEHFLFDEGFRKMCDDCDKGVAAVVLFGMIVRERRRVASLARTASSLDERAQMAEKQAAEKEDILRSYMDEQRNEMAALTQAQREQIIALMGVVKDSSISGNTIGEFEESVPTDERNGPNVMVLANEQISILEQQLEELRAETQSIQSYRTKISELNAKVDVKTQECENIEEESASLRSLLRQIREIAETQINVDDEAGRVILEIVSDALHRRGNPSPASNRRTPPSRASRETRRVFSPRLKKHVEMMHTSDSEDLVENVEWADDIMADLAIIAEGLLPPSLVGAIPFDKLDESFSRDPPAPLSPTRKQQRSKPPTGRQDRQAMSKEITAKLDSIVVPNTKNPVKNFLRANPIGRKPGSKSVFERLGSPSAYTGTQKAQYHSRYGVKDLKDPAQRLLDDLLHSDSDATRGGKSDREVEHTVGKIEIETEQSDKEPSGSFDRVNEYTQQDVFERLQRTTTQAYAVKHDQAETDRDNASSNRIISKKPKEKSPASATTSVPPSASFDRVNEYTQQDVFERLQRTTTQAYAVRHDQAESDRDNAPSNNRHAPKKHT